MELIDRKNLTPIGQGVLIKKMFGNGNISYAKNGIIWEGNITPNLISQSYRIRIIYSGGVAPIIRVISPKQLPMAKGENILPHIYSQKKQKLCLYYPPYREWHKGLPIVETIVPWVSEWLWYYELWVATGKWLGGGKH